MGLSKEERAALDPAKRQLMRDQRNDRDDKRKAVERARAEERERFERLLAEERQRFAVEIAKNRAGDAAAAVVATQDRLRSIMAMVERCVAARRFASLDNRDNGIPSLYPDAQALLATTPPGFEREIVEWLARIIDGMVGRAVDSQPAKRIDDPRAWLLALDATTLPADYVAPVALFQERLRAFLHEDAMPSDRRRLGELLGPIRALRRETSGTEIAEVFQMALDQIRRSSLAMVDAEAVALNQQAEERRRRLVGR